MEYDVNYSLDQEVRNSIVRVREVILKMLNNTEIFLFGSIAKGRYSRISDVDLLVLIDGDRSTKELRKLRHELEDNIEELNIGRDVDVKLYNKDRYNELIKSNCFEKAILDDLIDIRGW